MKIRCTVDASGQWPRCGRATDAELAAFKQAIRAKTISRNRRLPRTNAETIVTKFYSADVVSVGEGEGVFIGRDAIRPLYSGSRQEQQGQSRVHSKPSSRAMRLGLGRLPRVSTDGKTEPFTFAIVFLWTRVNGEWLCKGDSFGEGQLQGSALNPL